MKFNFSKSYLVGPTAHALVGFKVTNSTYKEALDVLHERFENVSIIIGNNMDELLPSQVAENGSVMPTQFSSTYKCTKI